jgi:Cu(I)/Ag(I) efflux system membrane fusion protein
VVASGLFLIDSEANITGALERMRAQAAQPLPPTPTEERNHD